MFDGTIVGILKDAGPWVTIALLVVSGLLVPRRVHTDRVKDYQARLQFTEKALEHERQINITQGEQIGKLLVLAEAGNRVLEALHKASKEAA